MLQWSLNSAQPLSAIGQQPSTTASRVPRSRTENLLLPRQACFHLHLYPNVSSPCGSRTQPARLERPMTSPEVERAVDCAHAEREVFHELHGHEKTRCRLRHRVNDPEGLGAKCHVRSGLRGQGIRRLFGESALGITFDRQYPQSKSWSTFLALAASATAIGVAGHLDPELAHWFAPIQRVSTEMRQGARIIPPLVKDRRTRALTRWCF